MLASRRVGSIVTALCFALQFVLLGSGSTCVRTSFDRAAMVDMAGMDMGDAPPASAPQQHPRPCNTPWAPADCLGIAPCAPAAIASVAVVSLAAPQVVHERTLLVMLPLPLRNTAPEPPPPKA